MESCFDESEARPDPVYRIISSVCFLRFGEDKINMIILIGGAGSSGKTKLANTLMKAKGIPYLSIDHLMMGIYRSGIRCGYTPVSDLPAINAFLWPVVREMIKTNIENRHSQIFEGFQIRPENLADFPIEYRASIFSIFITLDEKYIEKNYEVICRNRSAIEFRTDTEDKDLMIRQNIELQNECRKCGLKWYSIKEDFEREYEEIRKDISSGIDLHVNGA